MDEKFSIEESAHDKFVFTVAWWMSTFAIGDMLRDEPERFQELMLAISTIPVDDRQAFAEFSGRDAAKGLI